MIVVFDSVVSERANELRVTILRNGLPCAVCDPKNIGNLLPIGIIVTFSDQIDVVRRMPYDSIPVIAYGNGFVNSALNAVKAEMLSDVIRLLMEFVARRFSLTKANSYLGKGAFFYPGVFLSTFQVIVYGSRFDLTENENMIIRCMILSGDCYRSAKQLVEYCSSGSRNDTCIRVHVHSINKKGEVRLPHPLVESRHGHGYRFGYIDDHSIK